MSNNDQTPNWGNNPAGGQPLQPQPGQGGPQSPPAPQQGWGPGPGQPPPNQGHPNQGTPQQGTPPQGWGPGPGQAPSNQGYPNQGTPNQGYPQQPPPGWGQQPGSQQGAPVTKKKSRAPFIVAGALALALVVGGVVFAMSFLRGATPAAAEGIPGNAMAVFEMNLNPSVTDKLAVKGFVEKFPALADDVSDMDGDYKKAIYQALADDTADMPDYSEVEPWLGDSIAVAILPPDTPGATLTDPDVMLVIQVSDEDKAQAFMAEHGDGAQVTFFDDLMLVTEEGTPAPDVNAIKDESLADSDDYSADMAKLGGTWLATGWVGNDLVKEFVAETGREAGIETEVPNARAAMGLKVEDDSAVMRAVSWSDEDLTQGPATSFLETLPSASLGAMSFSMSDSVHDLLWDQLEPMLAESPGTGEQLGITSKEDLKAVLGSEMAVAVGIGEDNAPTVGVKVRTDDPAKHESFLETIGSELGGVGIEHVTDGDVVTTTFGQSPSDFTDPAGTLADNDVAQKLTQASGDPQAKLWVDVPAILGLPDLGLDESDEMVQNLKPLSGIGVSSSILDDDYAETYLRVGTK